LLRGLNQQSRLWRGLAGLPVEKRKFHCLKHSIATHLLDAGADLAFVKDWLGHANIQNTTIYARLTTATLDSTARKVFASHRVV
jgi:site-specific recombinase XerD